MAHIDADQHGAHRLHGIRELHLVEIAPDLRVDLSQDVGRLGHVKASGVLTGYDLGGNLVHLEDLLDLGIVRLPVNDEESDLGVAESITTVSHHEVKKLFLELTRVILSLESNHNRILDSDLKL